MSHEQLDRNREIYRRHREGESYSDLAHEFGITEARIRQIDTQVRHDKLCKSPSITEIELACKKFDAPDWMNGRIQAALANRKLHIKNRWKKLSREEILRLQGIGDVAADIIEFAQKI